MVKADKISPAESPSDDESGGEEERKVVPGQSKRACDYCHRMKMRCINKENPPCNRCRSSGHPCTFDGPRKSKANRVEDRLKVVEAQMSTFQDSLNELVALQRAISTGGVMPPPLPTPISAAHGIPSFAMQEVTHRGSYPGQSQTQLPPMGGISTGGGIQSHRGSSSGINPLPPHQQNHTPDAHPTPQTLLSLESLFDPPVGGGPSPRSRAYPSISSNSGQQPNPYHSGGGISSSTNFPSGSISGTQMLPPGQPNSNNNSHLTAPSPSRPWVNATAQNNNPPLNPTAASSAPASDDEEETELIEAGTQGPWRSMLSLAEAARLEQDGHLGKDEDLDNETTKNNTIKPTHLPFDYTDDRPTKKRKSMGMGIGDHHNVGGIAEAMPEQKGNHTHAYQDPVDMGFCTEERGRELFNTFMQNCLVYIPVFDPEYDTWESLRKRSPFCITTIIMIAQKCEDGSATPSLLQRQCTEHAEKIGMSTLFTPVARIEVVQALIIMAGWGDTAWRPSGHALRIGTEMGLFRCLPYLMQNGMGANKSPQELQEEKPLVIGSRVWLALYETECQLALAYGRPTIFINGESVRGGREFLKHPLSIPTDSRIVNFCELQTIRTQLWNPFTAVTTALIPDMDAKIALANAAFDDWYGYWDHYYELLGYPAQHMLRESLITMRAASVVYTNSLILHGVRNKRDVAMLSESRQHLLIKATEAAELLVSMIWRGKGWAEKFRYGNLNTHTNIAFNARFLIRMSSLVPEAVNLRQVGRDVEAVLKVLATVPGFQFSHLLRNVLSKARRRHVLPPASKPGSPQKGGHPLPPFGQMTSTTSTSPSFTGPATSISNPGSESTFPLGAGDSATAHLDFLYAEQLFNDSSYNFEANNMSFVGNSADPTFAFDTWYPFPPLDPSTTAPALGDLGIPDGSPANAFGSNHGNNTGNGRQLGQWW